MSDLHGPRRERAASTGTPSALVHLGGRLDTVATGVVEHGKAVRLYLVRNPDKLHGPERARLLRRR